MDNQIYLLRPEDLERRAVRETVGEDDCCRCCGASLDDGEGYDGLCGNCADKEGEDDKDDEDDEDDATDGPFYNTMSSRAYDTEHYGPYATEEAANAGALRLVISAAARYRIDQIPRVVRAFDGWTCTVAAGFVKEYPELTDELKRRVYTTDPRYADPVTGDDHVIEDFDYLF